VKSATSVVTLLPPASPPWFYSVDDPRNESHLRVSSRETRPLWQQIRGFGGNICHFFSCFFTFSGFIASQATAVQPQPSIQPLQKKSCRKTYRGFLFFPACATINARTMKQSSKFKSAVLLRALPELRGEFRSRLPRCGLSGTYRRLAQNPRPMQVHSNRFKWIQPKKEKKTRKRSVHPAGHSRFPLLKNIFIPM
jgi:hypothetical protein